MNVNEDRKILSLLELNGLVRDVLEYEMSDDRWVEAELSEIHESRGHCYMELVQKDDRSGTPVARASAKCWASVWQLAKPHFMRVAGRPLAQGMKVLMLVHAQFHENYGFSWIVSDIDPTYTLGDMARKRMEILRCLKEEGVLDLQKELSLPRCCNRIAVISSEGAAGYGDFVNHLENNGQNLRFFSKLFPAIMQGSGVEQSVIAALNDIYKQVQRSGAEGDAFHCVVIIRGGGATSDLSGFDTLALAENIANFPLPIITGIGHERDESIPDLVSFQRVKTPTAAADLLINHQRDALDAVNDAGQRIATATHRHMQTMTAVLAGYAQRVPSLFSLVKTRQEARMENMTQRLRAAIERRLMTEHHRLQTNSAALRPAWENIVMRHRHVLDMAEQKMDTLHPDHLLNRGYSITLKDGKVVKDARELSEGDVLETRLKKGKIKSTVIRH